MKLLEHGHARRIVGESPILHVHFDLSTAGADDLVRSVDRIRVPVDVKRLFRKAFREEQLRDLERVWYHLEGQRGPWAGQLVQLVDLATK